MTTPKDSSAAELAREAATFKLPCGCSTKPAIDPKGPVFFNEFNNVVQCHKCGAQYALSAVGEKKEEAGTEIPCVHEWFEGRCVHCQRTPREVRTLFGEGEDTKRMDHLDRIYLESEWNTIFREAVSLKETIRQRIDKARASSSDQDSDLFAARQALLNEGMERDRAEEMLRRCHGILDTEGCCHAEDDPDDGCPACVYFRTQDAALISTETLLQSTKPGASPNETGSQEETRE